MQWSRAADGGRWREDVGRGIHMLVYRGGLLGEREREGEGEVTHSWSL